MLRRPRQLTMCRCTAAHLKVRTCIATHQHFAYYESSIHTIGADPYSSCHSIDSFLAKEVPAYPNTTMKLIVVAHKMAGEGTNSTSMLSIYDDSFTLMSTPIYNFDGHISSVIQMPNPKTNYQTSLITYSGDAFPVLNGTVCNDCGYVSFIEMNLMQPSLFANQSAVYVPLGDIFCVGKDNIQFVSLDTITSIALCTELQADPCLLCNL